MRKEAALTQFQLIHVEGMRKTKSLPHGKVMPFAKHAICKVSPPPDIYYKGKMVNFTVEKASRYHLNQVIKVNITYPPTGCTEKGRAVCCPFQ